MSAPGAELRVDTPGEMHELGRRLAAVLRAGDLVLLSGGLGAGKTTLARGLGEGLGVRGAVTSPTFVIARVHPSTRGGPDLVHVDAYRLAGLEEVDDLDLDASLAESVTVVEWGEGLVETLSQDRLEVRLQRPRGAADDGGGAADESADGPADEAADGPADDGRPVARTVRLHGVGARWAGVVLPGV